MSFSGFRRVNRSQLPMQTPGLSSTPITPIQTVAVEVPRYDRQIDILVGNTSITRSIPLEKRMFDMSGATTKPKSKLQGLPPKIRLLIYEQLMPPSKQFVSLDRQAVREKMAPDNHFQVPDDILWCVWGLIKSCTFMREDVMSYFWGTFAFHATFSPMITKGLNFGSMSYLPRWGHKVQRLSIELDFTTLGESANLDEIRLKFSKKKLQESFSNIIKQISRRGGHSTPNTIQYLHILCRRFAGYRPAGQDRPGRPLLYCPEFAMTIIHEDLIKIKKRILSLRLSGFTQNYTIDTIKSVFPAATRVIPVLMETSAWPNVTPAIFLSDHEKQALYDQLLVLFGAVDTEATRANAVRAARRQAEEEKPIYFANAKRIRHEHKLAKHATEEREVQKQDKETKKDGSWKQAAEQPEKELDHDVEVASDLKLDGNADDDQSASAYNGAGMGTGEGAGDDESIYNDDDYEDELVNSDDEEGQFAHDHEQTCANSDAVDGDDLGRTTSGMKLVSLGLGEVGVRQLDGSVMTLEKHRAKRATEKKELERANMLEQNVKNRMDSAFRVTARAMNRTHIPPTNFDEIEHSISQERKEEEEKKEKKGTAGRKVLAKMASHLRLRK